MSFQVIPKSVEDQSLKRARTEIVENGVTHDAIRVVTSNGGGTIAVNAQDFADGTGLAPTNTYAGSVNHKLIGLSANATTSATNTTSLVSAVGTTADTSSDSTVIGVLKSINTAVSTPSSSVDLTTVNTNTTAIDLTQGTTSDAAWDGLTSNATVISLLKGIYNKM